MNWFEEIKNRYRVKNRKLLYTYQEGYIGKNVYEVTLNDGTVKRSEQILKNKGNGDAVVIIPITELNRFVIIIESRPVTAEEVAIEFPAGMVDPGEEFVDAAKRELEEETGYVSNDLREIEWHYQDQGCSNAIIKVFVAKNCEKKSQQSLDPDEALEPLEVSLDDLMDLYDSRLIIDASSRLALLTYLRDIKNK